MAQKKGLRSRAVGFLPAKANPVAQKEFLDSKLNPLITQAENGIIELFFVDASHFVMGGFAGRGAGSFQVVRAGAQPRRGGAPVIGGEAR